MYDPATVPYTEPTGKFKIMYGYDIYYDTMPYNNNIFIPLITLNEAVTVVAEINPATQFSLYPNPFSTQAVLKFNNPSKEKYTLSIYNLEGQLVKKEENIVSDYVYLNRQNFGNGMFFFQLANEAGGIFTGKFIVN